MKTKCLVALGVVVFVSVFSCFQSALAEGEAPQAREGTAITAIPGVPPDAAIAADGTAEGVVIIKNDIEGSYADKVFNPNMGNIMITPDRSVVRPGTGVRPTRTSVLPTGESTAAGSVSTRVGTIGDIGSAGLIEPYSPDAGTITMTPSGSVTPETTVPALPDVGSGEEALTTLFTITDVPMGSDGMTPITAPTGQVTTNTGTAATITMTTTTTPITKDAAKANAAVITPAVKGAPVVKNVGRERGTVPEPGNRPSHRRRGTSLWDREKDEGGGDIEIPDESSIGVTPSVDASAEGSDQEAAVVVEQ